MAIRLLTPLILLVAATPAFAAASAPVPEAPAASLFALGLLGVIVGRRASMKRKDKGEE